MVNFTDYFLTEAARPTCSSLEERGQDESRLAPSLDTSRDEVESSPSQMQQLRDSLGYR